MATRKKKGETHAIKEASKVVSKEITLMTKPPNLGSYPFQKLPLRVKNDKKCNSFHLVHNIDILSFWTIEHKRLGYIDIWLYLAGHLLDGYIPSNVLFL